MTGYSIRLSSRIPISFASIVMGIGGLGLAWNSAARTYLGFAVIGEILVYAATLLWIALAASYAAKWAVDPRLARTELAHPVSGAFVPLLPASLMLLLPALAAPLGASAKILFLLLAAAQIAATIAILARWLAGGRDPADITPAWHLAAVAGPLFAGGAAAAVGFRLTGWCFFGAGVLAWLAIESLVLHRLATQEPLPPPLRPLAAIELAAPAAVLINYFALSEGEADALTLGLFGWTLFVALLLLAFARSLCRAPFGPAYWGFAFPAAALSVAAWRVALATSADPAWYFALVLFVAANLVVAVIGARTIHALARGKFLPS